MEEVCFYLVLHFFFFFLSNVPLCWPRCCLSMHCHRGEQDSPPACSYGRGKGCSPSGCCVAGLEYLCSRMSKGKEGPEGCPGHTGDDSDYPEWQSWEVRQQSGKKHRFGRQCTAWGRMSWRGWSRRNASSCSWNTKFCWRKPQRQWCCPRVRSGYPYRQCQRERYSCHLASDARQLEIRDWFADNISDQPPMEGGWQRWAGIR